MKSVDQEIESREILGLPINICSKKQLLQVLTERLSAGNKTIIYGLCAGSMARIKNKKSELPEMLKEMDIIVPDGSSIPLLGKVFKVPVKEVIPITELTKDILRIANEKKLSVMLLGATEESNTLAIKNLSLEFPGIVFPPGIHGYYDKEKEYEIVEQINRSKADILLIGMTYPYKEKFATRYKDALYPGLIVPCGGAIDVFSGKTKRPPKLIKKLMLTWLYRWIQEPRRLKVGSDFRFMLITLPVLILKHLLGIEKNPSLIKHYKVDRNG